MILNRLFRVAVAGALVACLSVSHVSPAQAGFVRNMFVAGGVGLLARHAVTGCIRSNTCRAGAIGKATDIASALAGKLGKERFAACLANAKCRDAAAKAVQMALAAGGGLSLGPLSDFDGLPALESRKVEGRGDGKGDRSESDRKEAADRKDPRQDKNGNPLGTDGVRTPSTTVTQTKGLKNSDRGYYRIDVENASPGKRPGQMHAQFGGEGSQHHRYNHWTGKFDNLSPAQERLLDNETTRKAIIRGLDMLGLK